MGLFNGFTTMDLLANEPRVLAAVLSQELARTNQAVEALSEEIKQARAALGELEGAKGATK